MRKIELHPLLNNYDISHTNCFQIKVTLTHNKLTIQTEVKSDI